MNDDSPTIAVVCHTFVVVRNECNNCNDSALGLERARTYGSAEGDVVGTRLDAIRFNK